MSVNLTTSLIQYLKNLESQGEKWIYLTPQAQTILQNWQKPTQTKQTQSTHSHLESLDDLILEVENWSKKSLPTEMRKTLVFFSGNSQADLMFVGEAPGEEEEKAKQPFVGPAGQKLDQIIKAMGISRQEVYVTNIVKHRPNMGENQGTKNRKPTSTEIASYLSFFKREVAIIAPKCIVALGASAAEGLLGHTETVASLRGEFHAFENIPVRVTYHPSYLLRNENNLTPKRQVWVDMLAIMEKINLPISEKQRAFFT